jgi:hypothetical protein
MVFIIIPRVRRRIVIYYCPHCRIRQRFYSLLPVLTPEWRCKRCHKTFKINASCVGSNWAGVFAVWSTPLTWLATSMFLVLTLLLQVHRGPAPMSVGDFLKGLLVSVLCAGPMLALIFAPMFAILGFFVGLFYGLFVANRH